MTRATLLFGALTLALVVVLAGCGPVKGTPAPSPAAQLVTFTFRAYRSDGTEIIAQNLLVTLDALDEQGNPVSIIGDTGDAGVGESVTHQQTPYTFNFTPPPGLVSVDATAVAALAPDENLRCSVVRGDYGSADNTRLDANSVSGGGQVAALGVKCSWNVSMGL